MDCFEYVTVLGELEAKGDSGLFLAFLWEKETYGL